MKNDLRNVFIILILICSGVIGGMFLGKRYFRGSGDKPSLYTKFEQIRYLKRLYLVSYHFEEIIPITESQEDNDIKLMLMIPAKVDGYIDLEDLKFTVINDSLVRVYMPKPKIANPVFEIDKAKSFPLHRFGLNIGTDYYDKIFNQIKTGIVLGKKEVITKSIANDILSETLKMGKLYIQSFVDALGFEVQFVDEIERLQDQKMEFRESEEN